MSTDAERPEARFVTEADRIDLKQLGAELLEQAGTSKRGHAQRTLYKHDGFTAALFGFTSSGVLPEHTAQGTVTIHLVSGAITISTAQQRFSLEPSSLLRLKPGIPHAVEATADSVMLLHIGLAT